MISVSGLSKSFGTQTLFTDVTFLLSAGERYGLVGANGSGKTTLLNILGGDEESDGGSLAVPRKAKLGVLRQDQFRFDEEEILGVAMMGNAELWEAMRAKEALLEDADTEFDADRYAELEDIVMRHDGYAAEARAAEILEGLGLPAAIHRQPLATLSGGFKLRVLLAQVLAGGPDALLLDEPTNHLDIISIRWLEKFMQQFDGAVLVISHDHRFLDNVCTQILDVDYQTVTQYPGNYSAFVQRKVADRERREKGIAKREKEIAHHQKFVERFRAKSSKARQAQSKLRMIEKKAESLEQLPQSSRRRPLFRIAQIRPPGRQVLALEGVTKAFGDNEVLHGVDLTVRRGEKVAIMGPNGIGKSTLLKICMNELDADGGDIEWGYEARPGYFAQHNKDQFGNGEQSAEAWIWDMCSGETIGFVRNQMGRVLFSGDDAAKKLSALSGGEAARLVFCRLAIQKPNVLILDEPTNHLDLDSIDALVEGLTAYDGTLIFVSHDRWFVSQLATRIVEIKPNEILDYVGSYDEYVHYCGDDHLDAETVVLKARRQKRAAKREAREDGDAASTAAQADGGSAATAAQAAGGAGSTAARGAATTATPRPAKVSKNRLRRLRARRDQLVGAIAAAEKRIDDINENFCDPRFYDRTAAADVRALEAEQAQLKSRVDELTQQWEAAEGELTQIV